MESDSPNSARRVAALQKLALTRFFRWSEKFKAEWSTKLAAIDRLEMSSLGRAQERLERYQQLLSHEIRKRIRIYKKIAHKENCWEMFSEGQLDLLREQIMQEIRVANQGLLDRNLQDCRAAGDAHKVAIEAMERAVERVLVPFALGVVNVELDALAALYVIKVPAALAHSVDVKARGTDVVTGLHRNIHGLIRKEKRITMKELAAKFGLSDRTLYAFEKGDWSLCGPKATKTIVTGIADMAPKCLPE